MYTNGSNALKDNYYTYDNEQSQKNTDKKKRINAKKAKKNRMLLKKRIVAFVALVSSMSFIILFRYAAIAKEFSELSVARNELETINAKVVETQMKAEGNVDPKKIEKEAEKLGLKQPTKDQVKYISLGNTDNGEVLKTEKINALSAFINRISVILEYLC